MHFYSVCICLHRKNVKKQHKSRGYSCKNAKIQHIHTKHIHIFAYSIDLKNWFMLSNYRLIKLLWLL